LRRRGRALVGVVEPADRLASDRIGRDVVARGAAVMGQNDQRSTVMGELIKITVRGRGKAHRAFREYGGGRFHGHVSIACSCPGAQNGTLAKRCTFVCVGWDKANCGN
jgi:hypothetical protein